jgi:hypothetical protein
MSQFDVGWHCSSAAVVFASLECDLISSGSLHGCAVGDVQVTAQWDMLACSAVRAATCADAYDS